MNCSSLTSVSIPNSVTSIGDFAFSRCHGLTEIQSLPTFVLEGGEKEWSRIELPKEKVYEYIAEHRNKERIKPSADDAKDQLQTGNRYYEAKDYKLAVYWYKKAAEQGLAEAQYNLGLRYFNGEGVA